MAITVGLDFGTHQTKVCIERSERGGVFYEILQFSGRNGSRTLTLPSILRILPSGGILYGNDATEDIRGSEVKTYFKQKMFSWRSANESARMEAEIWSVIYLSNVVLLLDSHLGTSRYIVHMGMPTDCNPEHYSFSQRQAIKVLSAAMQIAREDYGSDMSAFLETPAKKLIDLAQSYLANFTNDINEARRKFPIFVFPEAYASLIPLIDAGRLPDIGPSLLVDIGGGTVDISFFTNEKAPGSSQNRPRLYHYSSIPYGLNRITGQDMERSHNVKVDKSSITGLSVNLFRNKVRDAMDNMMKRLKQAYYDSGRSDVMPFANLCARFHNRPVCYSGGGSLFRNLRMEISNRNGGISYGFTDVRTVSELINHSNLVVDETMFHVLVTAFTLSHGSILNRSRMPPDFIELFPLEYLFRGVSIPQSSGFVPDWKKGHKKYSW